MEINKSASPRGVGPAERRGQGTTAAERRREIIGHARGACGAVIEAISGLPALEQVILDRSEEFQARTQQAILAASEWARVAKESLSAAQKAALRTSEAAVVEELKSTLKQNELELASFRKRSQQIADSKWVTLYAVERLPTKQSLELFNAMFRHRREFHRALLGVPGVQSDRVQDLERALRGEVKASSLCFELWGSRRTEQALQSAFASAVESFKAMSVEERLAADSPKRAALADALASLPRTPEAMISLAARVSDKATAYANVASNIRRAEGRGGDPIEAQKRVEARRAGKRFFGTDAATAIATVAHIADLRDRYLKIREYLYLANVGLGFREGRRFQSSRDNTKEDNVQVAAQGLLKAIERFNPASGLEFSTAAGHWMFQTLQFDNSRQHGSVTVPRRLHSACMAVRSAVLSGASGAEVEAVAAAYRLSKKYLPAVIAMYQPTVSSQDSGRGASHSRHDLAAGGVGAELIDADERAALRRAVASLPAREARVLEMRFGLSNSKPAILREVADAVGLTREGVRVVERRALVMLRLRLAADSD